MSTVYPNSHAITSGGALSHRSSIDFAQLLAAFKQFRRGELSGLLPVDENLPAIEKELLTGTSHLIRSIKFKHRLSKKFLAWPFSFPLPNSCAPLPPPLFFFFFFGTTN